MRLICASLFDSSVKHVHTLGSCFRCGQDPGCSGTPSILSRITDRQLKFKKFQVDAKLAAHVHAVCQLDDDDDDDDSAMQPDTIVAINMVRVATGKKKANEPPFI